MARSKNVDDLSTLQMALVGYQIEQQRIENKIREIQAQLKGQHISVPSSASASGEKAPRAKRVLSPAARKRIAAAQKKRWAEHRKRMAQGAKTEG
jgi:hypothetical protein